MSTPTNHLYPVIRINVTPGVQTDVTYDGPTAAYVFRTDTAGQVDTVVFTDTPAAADALAEIVRGQMSHDAVAASFRLDNLRAASSAWVRRERYRNNLIAALTSDHLIGEHQAKILNEVAEAEAQIEVHLSAAYRSPADALDEAIDMLATGANDTWSGRANDVRRSAFDGKRDALKAIIRTARTALRAQGKVSA
jgi:hypothetical protein